MGNTQIHFDSSRTNIFIVMLLALQGLARSGSNTTFILNLNFHSGVVPNWRLVNFLKSWLYLSLARGAMAFKVTAIRATGGGIVGGSFGSLGSSLLFTLLGKWLWRGAVVLVTLTVTVTSSLTAGSRVLWLLSPGPLLVFPLGDSCSLITLFSLDISASVSL